MIVPAVSVVLSMSVLLDRVATTPVEELRIPKVLFANVEFETRTK